MVGSEDRDPLRVETAAAAQPLNCLLSLFGRAIAILKSHQRAPRYRHPNEGSVMSGVAIVGLAAVSVLLGVNIAIAVAVVVLDRR